MRDIIVETLKNLGKLLLLLAWAAVSIWGVAFISAMIFGDGPGVWAGFGAGILLFLAGWAAWLTEVGEW